MIRFGPDDVLFVFGLLLIGGGLLLDSGPVKLLGMMAIVVGCGIATARVIRRMRARRRLADEKAAERAAERASERPRILDRKQRPPR